MAEFEPGAATSIKQAPPIWADGVWRDVANGKEYKRCNRPIRIEGKLTGLTVANFSQAYFEEITPPELNTLIRGSISLYGASVIGNEELHLEPLPLEIFFLDETKENSMDRPTGSEVDARMVEGSTGSNLPVGDKSEDAHSIYTDQMLGGRKPTAEIHPGFLGCGLPKHIFNALSYCDT